MRPNILRIMVCLIFFICILTCPVISDLSKAANDNSDQQGNDSVAINESTPINESVAINESIPINESTAINESAPTYSPPLVISFNVTPLNLSLGASLEISYTVSSNNSTGLKTVLLWRTNESDIWQEINTTNLTGKSNVLNGSFNDSPPAPGKYRYGLHVVDNAGSWNDEQNSNTMNQPGIYGPVEVGVNNLTSGTIPKDSLYLFNVTTLNSASLPLNGAKVIIDGITSNTSGPNGKLSVLLSDGNHTINASKSGEGTGNWSGYLNHTLSTSINITLKPVPKYPFIIYAVNSANISMDGVDLTVNGLSKGKTNANGVLRVELEDGNHTIKANKSGYGSGYWSGRLDHARMNNIIIRLNGSLDYPFKVIVTNAAGFAMYGANVSIDGAMKGTTDQDGVLRVMLLNGRHTIEANKTDYGSGNWTGVLNYSLESDVPVRLNGLLEYPFEVTVVNTASFPLQGAVVSKGGVNKGVTDQHGHLIAWLTEGNQTIFVNEPGYGSGNWTGILNYSSSTNFIVKLNGSMDYPLNITVINPARYTIADAMITIDGKLAGKTEANGTFSALLSEGKHTIGANRTGYLPGNWTGQFNHLATSGLVIELGGTSLMMELKPIDLCLVLDTSGSMNDSECIDTLKIDAAKKAAQDTISGFFFPGTPNRIAVVSFSDVSSTASEFTNNYFEAYNRVDQLYADGFTSFGLGLEQALFEFSKIDSKNRVPVILFMSDGMHNTEPDFGYPLAKCMNKRIKVYTVGYGSEADHDLLREMADLSGGEYLFADTCGNESSKIQNAFVRLEMMLSGWENISATSGFVTQNGTVVGSIVTVPPKTSYVIFTVTYPGSHLNVTLIGPDDKVVDPNDYVFSEDKRVITIRMKSPKPGNYRVQIYGDQVGGDSEPFSVFASAEYVSPTIPAPSGDALKTVVVKETSGENLTDYPVMLSISGKDFPADVEADGSDIKFFDQNGNVLPRWVEGWDASRKKGVVWIKVSEIPANGEVRLTMIHDNLSLSTNNSGLDVFDFFDDFDSSPIDPENWTISKSGQGSVDLNNSLLCIRTAAKSVSAVDVASTNTFSSPVAVRFKANVSAGQNNDWKVLGLGVSNANHGLAQPNSSVCFNAVVSNLFSYHSLTEDKTEKNKRYPVLLAYPVQNITWGIRWHATGIEFSPSGNSRPHELSEQANESIPLRFGINTTMAARASEITLDWVSAWRCASKEPVARVE